MSVEYQLSVGRGTLTDLHLRSIEKADQSVLLLPWRSFCFDSNSAWMPRRRRTSQGGAIADRELMAAAEEAVDSLGGSACSEWLSAGGEAAGMHMEVAGMLVQKAKAMLVTGSGFFCPAPCSKMQATYVRR